MRFSTWCRSLGMVAAGVSCSSTRKRTYLSLYKKVEITSKSKDNPGIGVRALADILSCSKMQIAAILQQKESILASYESNASTSKKNQEHPSFSILMKPSINSIA